MFEFVESSTLEAYSGKEDSLQDKPAGTLGRWQRCRSSHSLARTHLVRGETPVPVDTHFEEEA